MHNLTSKKTNMKSTIPKHSALSLFTPSIKIILFNIMLKYVSIMHVLKNSKWPPLRHKPCIQSANFSSIFNDRVIYMFGKSL